MFCKASVNYHYYYYFQVTNRASSSQESNEAAGEVIFLSLKLIHVHVGRGGNFSNIFHGGHCLMVMLYIWSYGLGQKLVSLEKGVVINSQAIAQ